ELTLRVALDEFCEAYDVRVADAELVVRAIATDDDVLGHSQASMPPLVIGTAAGSSPFSEPGPIGLARRLVAPTSGVCSSTSGPTSRQFVSRDESRSSARGYCPAR